MKRFLSLALAAAMTLSLVPVSAFASSYNRISKVVTVEKDDVITESKAPSVVINDENGDLARELKKENGSVEFELVLNGAEWDDMKKVTVDSTATTLVKVSEVGGSKGPATQAAASVDIDATTVEGTVNKEITPVDVTVRLTDDTLAAELAEGTDVSTWFENLPAGLVAKVKTTANKGAAEVVVTISGTPTKKADAVKISVKVPGTALTGAAELTTTNVVTFNVAEAPQTPPVTGDGSTGDETTETSVTIEKLTSTRALVTVTGTPAAEVGGELVINLAGVKVTDSRATVTINPKESPVSADTFTFAKSVDGGTIVSVEGTKNFSGAETMKPIFIEEVTSGTFKAGNEITLKLNSGFKFVDASSIKAAIVSTGEVIEVKPNKDDNRTVTLVFPTTYKGADKAVMLKVEGITIDEDGADFEDVAEITVRGTNVDKTTVEMGKYIDWGVKVSAEDKTLPTIYSGMKGNEDDSNETLKLTLKETAESSWLTQRKTTLTFPEGVKVRGIEVDTLKGFTETSESAMATKLEDGIDGNVVTISANTLKIEKGKKAELGLIFDLVVAPDFTGDIEVVAGGPALGATSEVAVAKAVAPITVEAEKTSVAIDYRNVNVGDITIKEAEAGLWRKGDTIVLSAENMQFEKGMKAEIVEGDGEIKKLDVNKGLIKITVDSESAKTPMTIKLTDASLYLDRTLPAGDYALSLVKADGVKAEDALMFETYSEKDGNDPSNDKEFGFDVDEVVMVKDYVTVATAGRDQGTTFTTNVVVTIDSDKMIVDGQEVALDVPAFLSADGRTMLPVRAVTEALSDPSNTQPVDWIAGNPGTIMIYYGDKTVSMTLGSTTMYINGTPVPMTTAPVIVNDRAFLPMRDLGRALGLSDNQIEWDATARTATFNPVAEAK